MASRKRKLPDLQSSYKEIIDALAPIKLRLSDPNAALASPEKIYKSLTELANLAEAYTSNSGKKPAELADELDREGVNLWNTSSLFRPKETSDSMEGGASSLFASIRLAAYRMIEAGVDKECAIQTRVRLLQLANKTSSALTACGQTGTAGSVLTSAAKLEDDLRSAEDPTNEFAQARAVVTVEYYSSRMECAWKEDNEPVAFFMLSQAADEQRLSNIPPHNLELLSAKVLDIGKAMLKSAVAAFDDERQPVPARNSGKSNDEPLASEAGRQAVASVRWIQKALVLVEGLKETDSLGISGLKKAVLRSLARAYYFSSSTDPMNLSRSEATINELITLLSTDPRATNTDDFQQLRWMKLNVLKKKRASDKEITDAFREIIRYLKFNESNVTDVLQEIRTLGDGAVAVSITHMLLDQALHSENSWGHPFVDRILLALLFQSKSNQNHHIVLKSVEDALDTTSSHPSFNLPKVPTIACQSLLFQLGTRYFEQSSYEKAADYFLLCTHPTFRSMAQPNDPKCHRKAALCYIRNGEYARASTVLSRCSENEGATHYLSFLSAAYQGLEDEAIEAIQNMAKSPDFDRRLLLLATQLAHESQMKTLLLSVLDALLTTMQKSPQLDSEVEAITLLRCMIRIILELLKEPAANIRKLVDTLLGHFQTAKDLVSQALDRKSAGLLVKDISWLWRTAYNIAIQGCSQWDEEPVASLFQTAVQLMELHGKASIGVQSDVGHYMIMASFAAVCGRVFAARKSDSRAQNSARILEDVLQLRKLIKTRHSTTASSSERDQVAAITNLSYLFQVEHLCLSGSWKVLEAVVQEATLSNLSMKLETFEGIADLLWSEQDCPPHVKYTALEAILTSCLEQGLMACDKFSRWLRAMTTILLATNRPSDRVKAQGYVKQAVDVLMNSNAADSDQGYPQDERLWLLATSYNLGVESLQTSGLDEAKGWFEAATLIARCVQNGAEKAQQIEESYRALLSRYASRRG